MRMADNYVVDLKNGTKTDVVKYKPMNTTIKGQVAVELYDAETGEKTLEAKTENCINDIWAKSAYMDYFYDRIKFRTSSSSSSTYSGAKVYQNLFSYIILTDWDRVEDKTSNIIQGNYIGYASKNATYSGESADKGTVNTAETKVTYKGGGIYKAHFVFDFPTHSANGIIQSIYWSDKDSQYDIYNGYSVGYRIKSFEKEFDLTIPRHTGSHPYEGVNANIYNDVHKKQLAFIGYNDDRNYGYQPPHDYCHSNAPLKVVYFNHFTGTFVEYTMADLFEDRDFYSRHAYVFNAGENYGWVKSANALLSVNFATDEFKTYPFNNLINKDSKGNNLYIVGFKDNDMYLRSSLSKGLHVRRITGTHMETFDAGTEDARVEEMLDWVEVDYREDWFYSEQNKFRQQLIPVKDGKFLVRAYYYCNEKNELAKDVYDTWFYMDSEFNIIRRAHGVTEFEHFPYDYDNFDGKSINKLVATANDYEKLGFEVYKYYGIFAQWGASTRLARPIKKTTMNTMKIIYDFIIETVSGYQNFSTASIAPITPDPIDPTDPSSQIRGNTMGNIVNGGLATQKDGWVYYRSSDDCLYRTDGVKRELISTDKLSNLNVVGDYVYCRNNSYDNKLCKINIHTGALTKLCDVDSSNVIVVDDWIYYRNKYQSNFAKMFKVSVNGGHNAELIPFPESGDKAGIFNVWGDWIYYTDYARRDGLFKMKSSGEEVTKIEVEGDNEFNYMQISDGWIYYLNGTVIYKVELDGSNRTKLLDTEYNMFMSINVVGEWIYYLLGNIFYKMQKDGTKITKVYQADAYPDIGFDIIGEQIFYKSTSSTTYRTTRYKVSIYGESNQEI